MSKGIIAKKMEHSQLVLAKVRKVKVKKAKTAAAKSRKALRKRSRKGKKASKKRKTRRSRAVKKRGRTGKKRLPLSSPCKKAIDEYMKNSTPATKENLEKVWRACRK